MATKNNSFRPSHAAPPPLPVDALAFALLRAAEAVNQVVDGRNLDMALAACWQKHAPLPAMRGAIQELTYGTLRQHGRGDFLLQRLLREPLDNLGDKPLLRALLLVALYRLEARPAEAHTIVDQAVEAVARIGRGQFKALANAVLRNRLRQSESLLCAADSDEGAHYCYPRWWLDKIRATYPSAADRVDSAESEQWLAILMAGNTHPPMTLRVNRRQGTALDYQHLLTQHGIHSRLLDENNTALLLERPVGVDQLPGFFEGRVSVQDWGAQQAAFLLDVTDGQRVLDACAAPGGKTTHLLERADIELLALEAEATRSARIDENLRRLKLTATVKTADCRAVESWWDGRPYDRILADVPCSASGVVRRHPDIKWLRREQDVIGFARTQREILDALWRTLAPGGKMLYCTCSLFPLENIAQIDAFLHRHADAQCLKLPPPAGTSTAPLPLRDDVLQLTPSATHDGFFYALLQKRP
ncbi:MAG: Ribosomal small subunit methyltransferase [Pseudomonadota bacterium]